MSRCDNLQNKPRMSPCTKEDDIPRHNAGMENNFEGNESNDEIFEVVENGDVNISSESGSDEETDTLAAQGYISLVQSEDDAVVSTDIEQAELETGTENEDEKPTIKLEDSEERRIILGASSPSAFSSTQNSQMGEDEINLIKSVMKNIQLPSSAIPEWAKKIPEEKWKAPLVSALERRTSRENENIEKNSDIQSSSKTMS